MTTEEIVAALDAEIAKLQQVRAHLSSFHDPVAPPRKGPGRPRKSVTPIKGDAKKTGRRVLSAEARARIAEAQKKRWAAQKKGR